jgi:hypothetical protein
MITANKPKRHECSKMGFVCRTKINFKTLDCRLKLLSILADEA